MLLFGRSLATIVCKSFKHYSTHKPWYTSKGLNFKCTGCGKCCTGKPGSVFVEQNDIDTISEHLGLSKTKFVERYLDYVPHPHDKFSLKEVNRNGMYDCIFLREKRCSIYLIRPTQCKTYPFWTKVIESPESWKQESKKCEGINHPDSKVWYNKEIQKQEQEYRKGQLNAIVHQTEK